MCQHSDSCAESCEYFYPYVYKTSSIQMGYGWKLLFVWPHKMAAYFSCSTINCIFQFFGLKILMVRWTFTGWRLLSARNGIAVPRMRRNGKLFFDKKKNSSWIVLKKTFCQRPQGLLHYSTPQCCLQSSLQEWQGPLSVQRKLKTWSICGPNCYAFPQPRPFRLEIILLNVRFNWPIQSNPINTFDCENSTDKYFFHLGPVVLKYSFKLFTISIS